MKCFIYVKWKFFYPLVILGFKKDFNGYEIECLHKGEEKVLEILRATFSCKFLSIKTICNNMFGYSYLWESYPCYYKFFEKINILAHKGLGLFLFWPFKFQNFHFDTSFVPPHISPNLQFYYHNGDNFHYVDVLIDDTCL